MTQAKNRRAGGAAISAWEKVRVSLPRLLQTGARQRFAFVGFRGLFERSGEGVDGVGLGFEGGFAGAKGFDIGILR